MKCTVHVNVRNGERVCDRHRLEVYHTRDIPVRSQSTFRQDTRTALKTVYLIPVCIEITTCVL